MKICCYIVCCMLLAGFVANSQQAQEKVDSAAIAQIKEEGMNHSQVMEILSYLSDVYGPRLTGSPGYGTSGLLSDNAGGPVVDFAIPADAFRVPLSPPEFSPATIE